MASPSQNISSRNLRKKSQKHVETLANGGAALCLLFWVAALISQNLLRGSPDLFVSSTNLMISRLLVSWGASWACLYFMFVTDLQGAVTEIQYVKNNLKAHHGANGLLQLAFIVIYVTLLFSGRPLGSSECPFANYIFSRSLILQILPLCALFLGLNDHDLFYMSFYIFSQILVMVGLLPSFSYILLINLGPAMGYHVILVSCVVGGSFGLLLCIASTYRDILGEFGAKAKTRDTKI